MHTAMPKIVRGHWKPSPTYFTLSDCHMKILKMQGFIVFKLVNILAPKCSQILLLRLSENQFLTQPLFIRSIKAVLWGYSSDNALLLIKELCRRTIINLQPWNRSIILSAALKVIKKHKINKNYSGSKILSFIRSELS